ncbi:hypothetical protein B1748_31110 [Paenibacillus sp. MY03]|uniref:hypothetical protein n=1 Tax=Paenibacillus sp. MY03 TaxID=302980 RepID=UPI000B3CDC86|nr:hypothetical protein [Paenibacillus sp. MY03]OUS69615.1 hypothetical protein B1748_31110 [Paenibacillus sp. MY03]
MKKKILSYVLFVSLLSVPTLTYAHTVTETGSESDGYIIGTHAPTKQPKFWWTPGTDQYWKDRLNAGNNSMYSQTSNNLKVVNGTAFETNNYIEALGKQFDTWVARVVTQQSSGQHKDSWHLQFNTKYEDDYTDSQWNGIAQHELGHVFGLRDLYDSSNSAKLMYGYAGSYSGLKTTDLTGLKKIWGF